MGVPTPVNRIYKGNIIKYNGDLHQVLECVIRTPPNNAAYCQMELRSLVTGRSLPTRSSTKEQLEVMESRARNLEFSYENQGEYHFMDQKDYEQFELSKEIVADAMNFLVVGQVYEVLFVDGSAVSIGLPSSVVMKVTEAMDAIKGNSVSNVGKEIVLETGLKIQAPMFIKPGDLVKVGTKDHDYQGRA
jgi:elongation factor P